MHFLFCPSHWELLVQFMNRKQLIFDVALSSKWPSNPWTTLHFSPRWIRNLFLSLSLFICLSACSSPSLTFWSKSWNGVCVCVCVCRCTHVCYNLSPTVTKWCDRPCHMVDKWWMEPRQHTIKPVNLLGNVTSHLPPDVWPANTHKRGSRQKHIHQKPALTPHRSDLFLLACRPPHARLGGLRKLSPRTHTADTFRAACPSSSSFQSLTWFF